MFQCNKCLRHLTEDKFGVVASRRLLFCKDCSRAYKKAWREANRTRVNEYKRSYRTAHMDKTKEDQKRWRENNPNSVRATKLKQKFGISLEEYQALYESQGGACAICHLAPKKKMLAVDHCHSSGQIRGLLCDKCNMALGLLGDNRDLLLRAVEYLSPDISFLSLKVTSP